MNKLKNQKNNFQRNPNNNQENGSATESKTGIKTIDRLSELPVVNSALSNVTDYYEKVKEKNVLLRTSFNLAELSVKTMAFAATPITTLCKKPSNFLLFLKIFFCGIEYTII